MRTCITLTQFTILALVHQVIGFVGVPTKRSIKALKWKAQSDDSSNDILRNEIASMRKQALERLNNLDGKLSKVSTSSLKDADDLSQKKVAATSTYEQKNRVPVYNPAEDQSENEYAERRVSLINDPTFYRSRTESYKRSEALLEGTSWKLSFDIGREPGTWMPKDWGISGERIKLNLELEFTDQQLYDREEFLGGVGDARILHVTNNEMTLAPSLTEGSKRIRVIDGGWRVSKGQGPMGTDLLRFFIEIEEEISRAGKDVYCPAGRIYCNAGYFPTNRKGTGFKAQTKNDLDKLIQRAEELDVEIAESYPFSIDRIKKNSEMFRIKVEMQRKAELYRIASVAEPSSSILRFSPRGDVGLTREGGVCCKVNKGLNVEYHILGRFYISAKGK